MTQDGALGAPLQTLGNGVPAGGTFLYKFKVTRPGLFWYHPHHHNSLNRVFKGMYGMIVVTDPLEANIYSTPGTNRELPAAADTLQLVLSDITVCRTPGAAPPPGAGNYTATYADYAAAEWLSGVTAQTGPSPKALCEIAPAGSATDDDGAPATTSYGAGFVPSSIRPAPGVVNTVEGQTVLTNGVNVGGRLGTPAAPGALVAGGPPPKDVLSGQGIRLQIVNCATLRYFRLRLTYLDPVSGAGVQIPLVRVGGEGGLLDRAILEGGMVGTLNTNFDSGEILLPPATRADVVAAIPSGLPVGTKLTLWTRDYKRVGSAGRQFWSQLPTVPVMHMNVTGDKPGTPYPIVGGNVNVSPPSGYVTGIPAYPGTPIAAGMPGTTSNATPCSCRKSASAPPLSKRNGSPRFRRATVLPSRAFSAKR